MKDKLIQDWFKAWFDAEWDSFEDIFEKDVFYSESWGPEYHGITEVKKWFNDWHKDLELNTWEIKNIVHNEDVSFVVWYFNCKDSNEVFEFNGISMIEWGEKDKIKSLQEYVSSLPDYIRKKRFF